MIAFSDTAVELVGAALMSGAFLVVRRQSRAAAATRVRQLHDAAILLAEHAHELEQFLESETAPAVLKRLLIDFSDSMADPLIVRRMARWLSSRPLDQSANHAPSDELSELLLALRNTRVELVEAFGAAVLSAIGAAFLRWPDMADADARIWPLFMVHSQQQIALAVTTSRFRTAPLKNSRVDIGPTDLHAVA